MINKQKQKLTEDWFEDDQLIWLHGAFTGAYNKTTVKKMLDDLKMKWTIKYSPDVTRIITKTWRGGIFNYPKSYTSVEDNQYRKIGQSNIYNPNEFALLLKNVNSRDMSEYSRQIIDLLKTMDKVKVKLAITLIGDAMLEDKWIPWLLINKNNGTRLLLSNNNIGPGNWHVSNTKYNFRVACNDLKYRLKIPSTYMDEFLVEFYNNTK